MTIKRFAQLVSFVFHPAFFSLFMPFLIVHHVTGSIWYSFKWTIFSAVFLVIAFSFFTLVRPKKFLGDLDITEKEHRHIFYSITLLTAVIYFIASLLFKGILFPLSIVSLGIILGLVSFDIVNYYMKASIHVAVVSAYVVTIAMVYGLIPFFLTIWIVLLVGWSRLYMHKHTEKEILAGMMLGTVVTLCTFFVELLLVGHRIL